MIRCFIFLAIVVPVFAILPPCDRNDWPSECADLTPPSLINFETAPVHPMDLSPDGRVLAVAMLPAGRVELFDVSGSAPQFLRSIPVGLDPVSVRFRSTNELWVMNFISSSVSIVEVNSGRVRVTLQTLPGPADVVFAGTPARAFVSCARVNTIQVFDPATGASITNLVVDGDQPKALAVSPDGQWVYAAIFESGNASTIIGRRLTPLNVMPFGAGPLEYGTGPYGGQNPPPNFGNDFKPPINTNLPFTAVPPKVSHIVKKNAAERWMDDNSGDWTEFVSGTNAPASGRPMGWDMPDRDLVILDANAFGLSYACRLMNICMAVGVNPASGEVAVVGTDATNERRFEPNLQGTFVRVNVALVDPVTRTNRLKDLNPHLDYQTPRVSQALRDRSLGDPRAVVWNQAGTRAYVAGMGSRNIVAIDANGDRTQPNPIEVGEGPCGLALDESRQRLYVFNRFSATISVLNTVTESVVTNVPLFDPTPSFIKLGRKHLYDTRRNSGLGQVSCASCHVDGRFDRLAWDLGNPAGEMVGSLHPMKGPMVTQTFQDILEKNGNGFLHWRADRIGIESFNVAFTDLLGKDTLLTDEEMEEFRQFLTPFYFPPNFRRNFDNTLSTNVPLPDMYGAPTNGALRGAPLVQGDAIRGRSLSHDCRNCHPAFRGGGPSMAPFALFRSAGLSFKPAQLRSVAEKLGMDMASTNSRAGFGLFHDGRVDSVTRLITDGFPEFAAARDMADLTAWLLSFTGSGEITDQDDDSSHASLDVPAAVGRQLTLTTSNAPPLFTQMIVQAERATEGVDLVAHGTQDGLDRGWFYERRSRRFQSDRQAEDISIANLLALATPVAPLTFTAVTRGAGRRLGVDRDGDGYFDRTEIEAALDPTDPTSHGEPVPKPFYAEEWLANTQFGTTEGTYSIYPGQTLSVSLASEVFGFVGTYSLGGDVPPGASINATNGSFTWTPPQSGEWRFFVRATENVWPYLNDVAALHATAIALRVRFERTQFGDTLLLDGVSEGQFRLQRKRHLGDPTWEPLGLFQSGPLGLMSVLTGDKSGFYRVAVEP